MKILIIKTAPFEVDLKRVTYNIQGIGLGTELVRLGHEVGLVYYAEKGCGREETRYEGDIPIKIYHIEGKNIFNNAIYNNELYQLCEEYDVIQPSECDQFTSWYIYKKYSYKTVIYHGPYKSKYTRKHNAYVKAFDAIFLNNGNYRDVPVITKSTMAEEDLRKKGFSDIETLGVGFNPNGIDEEHIDVPNKLLHLKQKSLSCKYLLYVGSISDRKNTKFLLMIMSKLVIEKKKGNYVLLIVGKINDTDSYYKECTDFIYEKGLTNNVVFLGMVEQKYLKYIYNISNVFLLPTQYDIFGMVYLEAMYFGVPIITTLCGGSSLLIENDKNGYISTLDKPEEWISNIEFLLEDGDKRNKIASNAKKLIVNEFLWAKRAVKFIEVYTRVLEAK